MAVKEKKKKMSGVAKMVKSFLKRKTKPKLPASQKTIQPKKAPVSKPVKAKKTLKAPAKAVAKQQVEKPIVTQPKPSVKKTQPSIAIKARESRFASAVPYLGASARKIQASGPRYFFNTEIPDSYNETYMRAMPRDPQWLFAYWEISEATRKQLRSKMGESAFSSAKRILRLLDVTDLAYDGSNAERYNDIEINESANNWYVQVPESGRTYVLELGLLTTDGKFFLATRSNTVGIPRIGVSQIQDEDWATVSTDELIRMSADSMRAAMGSSERRFAAAETLVGHAGLTGSLGSGSGSGGLGDFSSGSRY
jgi:hypothetical protein